MRLLEYQINKFCRDCIYNEIKKHECASNGFYLARLMDNGTEFWLDSTDCTVEEFILALYEEVLENEIIPETELFEILARFLCGYDKYEVFKKEAKGIPENKYAEFFNKRKLRIDDQISDEEIKEKINFIKTCIEEY